MNNDTLTIMVLVVFVLIMLVGIMQFFLYTMMKYVHDMAKIDGKRIDAIVAYLHLYGKPIEITADRFKVETEAEV